jgi:hypothetical protein
MGAITFSIKQGPRPSTAIAARQIRRDLERAAIEATHTMSEKAYRNIQSKMRGAGLGKLWRAVGWTSSKRRGGKHNGKPYGVIFARDGDESRSGGALDAYANGVTIRAKGKIWLAYPTEAAPRLVSAGGRRQRLTPALWKKAGLDTKIGPLIFKPVSGRMAVLAVRSVSLSPKTGQAKALGKRRPRTRIVPKDDVVVFILIKSTSRAKRFDKDQVMRVYAGLVPQEMRRILASYQ